ncbi:MAG: ROK family protein [Bacillota bacterium]
MVEEENEEGDFFMAPPSTSATSSALRSRNMVAVLQLMMDGEPVSRAEISRRLHISPSTVGRVITDLKNMRLVSEAGAGTSTGGRTPQLLVFEPRVGYAIGIDISPSSLAVDILDLAGRPVAVHRCSFSSSGDRVMDDVMGVVRGLAGLHQVDPEKIMALGVAVPGVVDPARGIVRLAPNLGWENGYSLLGELGRYFNPSTEILVENDVNAGAYAEYQERKGDFNSLVFIRIDSGLGAGIILNGEIWRGSRNLAGEIGFSVVGPQWLNRDYGKRGCLECLCSGPDILARAEEAFGRHGRLSELVPRQETPEKRLARLYSLARQRDSLALKIVEETAQFLSIVIANLSCVVDPDIIVLAGWVLENGDILFERVRQDVHRILLEPPAVELTAVRNADIVVRGVTSMALEKAQKRLLRSLETLSEATRLTLRM